MNGLRRLSQRIYAVTAICFYIALALFGVPAFPLVLLLVALPAFLVLINVRGSRTHILGSRYWRFMPVRRFAPAMGALILIGYSLLASFAGYFIYSSGSSELASQHATATALVQIRATRIVWCTPGRRLRYGHGVQRSWKLVYKRPLRL